MAADKKQNRKRPSEETVKALGNSIDECWNELNNLPKKSSRLFRLEKSYLPRGIMLLERRVKQYSR